ncbi:hypothetical protein HYX04_05650 [Candidatus Woesearchaeota archaeon]|nr:hypothetical protein [Candidatus Woesearchaeota archaeon]
MLGFYYFVYNIILEWLEFVIDDPVVATGIIFYIYSIAKHHKKFNKRNFVFKIGYFSATWYRRFVSLFHYKKTLPLAISGLLMLHALSDLGVFAYSLIFLKENFYLELLRHEHTPFLKLFLEDIKNVPGFVAMPLLIVYLLNALSLAIFLIIPVIVWISLFSQKKMHFSRIFLFFIYASAAAYMLMPGYLIEPISSLSVKGAVIGEDKSISGVDVRAVSLLESGSMLDSLFPDKPTVVVSVSLIALLFGLAVYILASNQKIKKELYAFSVIGGLTFYAVYLFYFFASLLDFYIPSLVYILSPHFLIGIALAIFLTLSTFFYIGGYLMFLYEIVMEYHKRKWSEPIDEKLVIAIKKIKSAEKRMRGRKRAQIVEEVFKYAIVGVVSIAILIAGYKMVNVVKDRACKTEIAEFELELRNLDKSLRYGAKELQSHDVPCKVDKIYFFDINKDINPEDFKDIPIIKDTLKSKGDSNVFLVKDGNVRRSFYAGNLEMAYPYHICFLPKFDKISFFLEGAGKSAKIAASCEQPECTFIPINISEEESERIIKEAIEFGCRNCPDDLRKETKRIRLTRQNVEMFRKFTFCDGITSVEIVIRPKKGAEIKEFKFYEFIPKSCIEDLNNYLAENIEGDVEIKGDPLIMWYFSALGEEKKISYKLSKELSDECKQTIQGLGVAQFVEEEQEEVQKPEITALNTAPTIDGLPDVFVSGIGLKKNVISNLWNYANDKETNLKNLVYTLTDQTNSDLVDCSISNEKHVDCEVKQDKEGASRVTVQVDDFEFSDSASFNVEVTQFCKKHERKECVGNAVYWLDSCSNQEELDKACAPDEICKDVECEKSCTPNAERKCQEKDKIYWFDSCSKQGPLYYDCRENPIRTKCKNGQCCTILNLFCTAPTPSCTDECSPDSTQCYGSGYQVCNDYNNDGCFEWSQTTDCGSGNFNDCTDFGSWTCKDSLTRTRSRTCYSKGCSAGSCYATPWTYSQQDQCLADYECNNGNCVLKSGCAYNNPSCGVNFECIDNQCFYTPPPSSGNGGGGGY